MSQSILRLKNRIITDAGEVALGYEALLSLSRDGKLKSDMIATNDKRVEKYNKLSSSPLKLWNEEDKGNIPSYMREWNTPEPFRSKNIQNECIASLIECGLDDSIKHIDRLDLELIEIKNRNMDALIRHVMYIVYDFKKRNVVWGVGRGSCCASFILYLLGLHMIDPVMYNIPMKEFYK